ncbi:39S ribosomal protein L23, mitochondrial [Stylophora pistillata]|uniref:Large ribosomal subunit protein uL23m n=1 Tax=Stylophora pistillata TaxID=50429 RepID=A0A2B4SGW0_STYPI|nr:39S ribosomal protein L23, mitochondrial [Stylophora pistillata]
MKVVRPGRELPENTVQFHVPMDMSKLDIKNYLTSIYKLDVARVNTRIQHGKTKSLLINRKITKRKYPDYKVAYVVLVGRHSISNLWIQIMIIVGEIFGVTYLYNRLDNLCSRLRHWVPVGKVFFSRNASLHYKTCKRSHMYHKNVMVTQKRYERGMVYCSEFPGSCHAVGGGGVDLIVIVLYTVWDILERAPAWVWGLKKTSSSEAGASETFKFPDLFPKYTPKDEQTDQKQAEPTPEDTPHLRWF